MTDRSDKLEVLAVLAEEAPALGLDPKELRSRAAQARQREIESALPYSFKIWRHFVQYTERAASIGEAIDDWIRDDESDDCAMAEGGIFRDGKEVVPRADLETWARLSWQ